MSFANVNSSSQDVTIDIEIVKSGGSTTPHLLNDVTVPAGTTLVWETKVGFNNRRQDSGIVFSSIKY